MSTKTRCLTMLAALVLAVPVAASAQEATPLTRDDLVRMLGGTTYTPDEVAEIVQRSCVSFEPTGADYEQFRELGANQAVVDAVRVCVEDEEGGVDRVEGLEVVQLTLSDDSLAGSVGDTLQLTATVGQEGNPRQGVRLVLRDTSSAGLGSALDLDGQTDGQGRVTFSVPAGEEPREMDLRVFASGVWLEGNNAVVLQVSPGIPTVVRLEPNSVDFQRQRVEQIEVRAAVEDRFGNPVPGTVVRIRSAEAGATEVGWTGRTDDQGRATVTIPASGLHDGERLEASVEGTVLASLPVAVREPAAIEDPEGRQPEEAELEGPVEAEADTDEQISEMVQRAGRLYRDGDLAAAREHFQAAVQADPTHVPARVGLGETALAQGDTRVAVQAYEAATRHDPESAEAWTGLGRARIAAGDEAEAREALERALELDPGRTGARRALDGLETAPAGDPATVPAAVVTVWGGYSPENGRDPGPRMAELVIHPSPQVRLWGSFDNALNLRRPFLVRGEVDFRAFYGGAAFDWGTGERFGTTVEVGRRIQPPGDLGQTVFRLEQAFRFGEGDDPFTRPSVHVGGVLGHWDDRDDYVVLAGAGVPVSPQFRLEPEAWYGETIGTVSSTGGDRVADREFRFSLGATARPHERVKLRPALAVGSVDSDLPAQTGELFDATFRASVRVAGPLALEGFFRYQSPPDDPSFTVVGFGTTIGIPR